MPSAVFTKWFFRLFWKWQFSPEQQNEPIKKASASMILMCLMCLRKTLLLFCSIYSRRLSVQRFVSHKRMRKQVPRPVHWLDFDDVMFWRAHSTVQTQKKKMCASDRLNFELVVRAKPPFITLWHKVCVSNEMALIYWSSGLVNGAARKIDSNSEDQVEHILSITTAYTHFWWTHFSSENRHQIATAWMQSAARPGRARDSGGTSFK